MTSNATPALRPAGGRLSRAGASPFRRLLGGHPGPPRTRASAFARLPHVFVAVFVLMASLAISASGRRINDRGSLDRVYRTTDDAEAWLLGEKNGLKETILKLHSKARGAPDLGASNMMLLDWDEDLAKLAQVRANKCVFRHGDLRLPDGRYVGQNLAQSAGQTSVKDLVDLWMMEKRLFNTTASLCRREESSIPCGHYHQLVTAATTHVGCALKICSLCPAAGETATSPHLTPTSPHLTPTSPHLTPTSPHLTSTSPHLTPTSPSTTTTTTSPTTTTTSPPPCYWFDTYLVCDYFVRGYQDQPAYARGAPCAGCNFKNGTGCHDNQCVTCDASKPRDEGVATEGTVVAASTAVVSAGACRPYDDDTCKDKYQGCEQILEKDFCSNPITGLWARRQCKRFCNQC